MASEKINEREIVLDILLEAEKGTYLTTLLKQVLDKYSYLPKQNRSFIKILTEGVTERRITLDYLISRVSSVKVKKIKPLILQLLRMGVYQLVFMDQIPDSAAINEAVKLAKKRGFSGLSGYVNGVLRSVSRMENYTYPGLSQQYSMPQWIVDLFEKHYGHENCIKMLQGSIEKPKLYIRNNPMKNTREELLDILAKEGVTAEPSTIYEAALILTEYESLNSMESFRQGRFTVQDLSSQLVGACIAPKDDAYVIDICSAPGGKAIHVANLMHGTGHVDARDLTEQKVLKIQEAAMRMDCDNLSAKVMDATVFSKEDEEKADIVIADLPCSGLGVLSRRTDLKYRITESDPDALVQLQKDILKNAVRYVKKGGVLLYSTCTVNPAENVEMIPFIESLGLARESIEDLLPASMRGRTGADGYLQLLQGVDETDGFFISRFRKL